MSKVFERLIAKQINSFLSTKISNLLYAYRKGHSAQHALIRLIETIRKTLDRISVAGMILMYLSKASTSTSTWILSRTDNRYNAQSARIQKKKNNNNKCYRCH